MHENNQKLVHTFGALADLGQEISGRSDFSMMIRTSLHLLLGSLAIRRGAVARFNHFDREFQFIATRGLGENFPLVVGIGKAAEIEILDVGLTAIEAKTHSENWLLFAREVFSQLAPAEQIELLIPLVVRGELVGLVLLGDKLSGDSYSAHDKDIICAMCRHVGVGIQQRNLMIELERRAEENLQLYTTLRFTYKATVESFATAIDCKDKYTEGHSQRVGNYSEIIAEELGWSEKQIEGVAVAGYLHDVGKLVVDRNIINSPTRITASENAQLSKHPAVGFEILSPIQHPVADVPLAAKYHHERLDGRGYPDGLKDDEIPYIAKIVNLADSFDAMTTDRPYKRRRPAAEVVEDLQRSAGGQFAPELVTAFCRAWYKELTGERKPRKILKMLGRDYVEKDTVAPLLKNVLNGISPTSRLTLIASD